MSESIQMRAGQVLLASEVAELEALMPSINDAVVRSQEAVR